MASEKPEEIHIRHCMLYEFRKHSNATVATKNICDVYPNALRVRKCQTWFNKFKSGNFDLSDSSRARKPKPPLDYDVLRAEVEENPGQTIEELSYYLDQPWSIVQKHLKQIGKVSRAGVLVPHDSSEEASRSTTCNSLPQRHKTGIVNFNTRKRRVDDNESDDVSD